MFFVACSGFPVPVSRYWADFGAVEISETELGVPGEGVVRRWVREAPKGFAFSLLAPKEIAASGFRKSAEHTLLLEGIGSVARKVRAKAIVFVAPDFKPSKDAQRTLKAFLASLPRPFPPVVLDLPTWKPMAVARAVEDRAAVAYDPLKDVPPPVGDFAYLRMPGPSGPRSRYDEASLERLGDHARSLEAGTTFCVFRNVDMHTNGLALRKLLGA